MTQKQKLDAGIRFPAAAQFFGANFHQDWKENASSPDEIVREFARIADVETRRKTMKEIHSLLAECTDEDALEKVLDTFGNSYDARRAEGSYKAWLERVSRLLQFSLPGTRKR